MRFSTHMGTIENSTELCAKGFHSSRIRSAATRRVNWQRHWEVLLSLGEHKCNLRLFPCSR